MWVHSSELLSNISEILQCPVSKNMMLNLEGKITHFHMQLDTNIDTNIIKNIFSNYYTKCILRYNKLTIKLEEIF